ncbi:hypothetical protein ACT7DZ_12315 [Bacillus cereus]
MKDGETTLTEESITQYCKGEISQLQNTRSGIHRRITEKCFRKSVEEGITRCGSYEIENYETMENPVMYKA